MTKAPKNKMRVCEITKQKFQWGFFSKVWVKEFCWVCGKNWDHTHPKIGDVC